MVCTAPWKAWQTTERGLRQSRTPHARSSCIIGNFLTIAWGTQILAIGDSQVRSYDRRTVSVEWSVRRANCKRFTHKRPTDGSVPRTVCFSVGTRSQWRCMSDAHVQRSSVSKPFSQTNEFSLFVGRPRTKHPQHKTPQLSTASKLPRQAGCEPTASSANSRECQTYGLFSG